MENIPSESGPELKPDNVNSSNPFNSSLENIKSKLSLINLKNRPLALVGLALVVVVLAGGYYWQQSRNPAKSEAQANIETAKIIAAVGKLVILPTDEEPAIATVSNPDLLKNQEFFANAKKGDKVLVYAKAKKAILYSPSLNKIVEIAPINLGNNTGNSPIITPSPTK